MTDMQTKRMVQATSGQWFWWDEVISFQPTSGAGIVWLRGAEAPLFVTREAIAAAGLRQGC